MKPQRAAKLLAILVSLAVGACGDTPTAAEGDPNPDPILTGLVPNNVEVGTPGATIRLNGRGFIPGSRVRLGASDRPTTFLTEDALEVTLSSADLSEGALHPLSVVNGPPGGGSSSSLTLSVGHQLPVLFEVDPPLVLVGAEPPQITLRGSGLYGNDVTRIQFGIPMITGDVVDESTMVFTVPASAMEFPHVVPIQFVNPGPGGGRSEFLELVIARPVPKLFRTYPAAVQAGKSVLITAEGSDLSDHTRVFWNGQEYPTTFVNETTVFAEIPGEDVVGPGEAVMHLHTLPVGGGDSEPVSVAIIGQVQRITGLDPPTVPAGSGPIELLVSGGPFSAASQATWNGTPRTTTLIDESTISVSLAATDLGTPGAGELSVSDPDAPPPAPTVGLPILPAAFTLSSSILVPIESAHIVADPIRDRVYVAVPAVAPEHENSVVALDATTGAIIWSTFAGSDPIRLAVSDDGSYLYAALDGAPAVSRFDLATGLRDLVVHLPLGENGTQRAEDILVLPGAPATFVVSLRYLFSIPRNAGVAVYDGDVRRPLVSGADRIEPSLSPDRIFGISVATTGQPLRGHIIRPDGVLADRELPSPSRFGNSDIFFDSGFIFSTEGRVLDPETRSIVAEYAGTGAILPDVRNGRVHFYDEGTLTSYHPFATTLIGSLAVPDAVGLRPMARIGSDGLAFGGGSGVALIRSNLVGS